MIKIPKTLGLGAGIGLVSWGLGRVYGWFLQASGSEGLATATFSTSPIDLPLGINVKQQILSGVNTDIASKLLEAIGGGNNIPAMMGLTIAIIAGIVIAFVGKFTIDALKGAKIPLPVGNKPVGKITALMVYGTLVSGVIISFLGKQAIAIPALGFVIAVVIYYIIVGWAYAGLRGLGLKMLPDTE